MTHHFICNHCRYENKISISETYQMQNGDFKDTTCTSCLRKEKTHINDIFGKVSRNFLIIGFCAGLLLSVVLLFILENYIIISTAIISIPTLVIIYETSLVKTFNNSRIRKK